MANERQPVTCTSRNTTNLSAGPISTPARSIGLPIYFQQRTQDFIDSLTAHISLYHSKSTPYAKAYPKSYPDRISILKWFSSLTVHQRRSHLTSVDYKFVQLLIKMISNVQFQGPGCFIILPDLPEENLPGLCYKKSTGLLSRVVEEDKWEEFVTNSVWLFDSREGENIRDCSCSSSRLDSMTVREDLVEDVDKFVDAMDYISSGGFLKGTEEELCSDWMELGWLKGKGYYTIGAFIVNRIEVRLRLAWMSSNGSGRKRGVKLKEKLASAGVAVNVFWRKKGCLDWWQDLSAETRMKVLKATLGTAGRPLVSELLKDCVNSSDASLLLFAEETRNSTQDDVSTRKIRRVSNNAEFRQRSRLNSIGKRPPSDGMFIEKLFLLQNVVELLLLTSWNQKYKIPYIFFSTLDSVCGTTDRLLRKLRGLLMIISLDCTTLDLLDDRNVKKLPCVPREKTVSSNRRKKEKSQNNRKVCSSETDISKLHHKTDTTCDVVSNSDSTKHSQPLDIRKEKELSKKNKKGKTKRFRSKRSSDFREEEKTVNEPSTSMAIDQITLVGEEIESPITACVSSEHLSDPTGSVSKCSLDIVSEGGKEQNIDFVQGTPHTDRTVENACGVTLDQTTTSPPDSSCCTSELESVPLSVSGCSSATAATYNAFDSGMLDVKAKFHSIKMPVKNMKLEGKQFQDFSKETFYGARLTNPIPYPSFEWPFSGSVYFQPVNSHSLPATDRLHLDVGQNWNNNIRQSFLHTVCQVRNSPIDIGCNHLVPGSLPMSLDWPPMVRNSWDLSPSSIFNYNSECISSRKSNFVPNYPCHGAQRVQFSGKNHEDDKKFCRDNAEFPETIKAREFTDECDGHWLSEDDLEMQAVSGMDYNQYFGGGVMYWNPSDQSGAGFSRPPSLSSDDSLWAWHEADINRAVDDMATYSSSYSTNGLASPRASSFCSPFDPIGSVPQGLGYVMTGNDVSGKFLHTSTPTDAITKDDISCSRTTLSAKIEGRPTDSTYPILRPIIIPSMSNQNHDSKGSCISARRQEQPRIKRPPSPVVLCVPRAPRPPPPSPVSEIRKHRGFPIVRSGSSSPRHWGMRSWYHEGINFDEACVCWDGPEVVWPTWTNKRLSTKHAMIQPLTGSLLQDRLFAISQVTRDQEHPDISLPVQPPGLENCPSRKASLSVVYSILHDEIDHFCRQVSAANLVRKPLINWAVKRVTRSLQVLWPRSRTNVFGSNATGLSLPTSDVDLVVCLPPVRNLEPIKEAGILEGRNGIKETCLQHAARYLANQEWVKSDSLRTVENTAIPLIKLVAEAPDDLVTSVSNVLSSREIDTECVKDVKSIQLDISFKSPSHTGLQTSELVQALAEQFPASIPLALVLKQFLADRSLDRSYSGGLSSYCLVLLVTRFLQHEHHLGRTLDKNLGNLLMDFLYFYGNVFDPRQMRISVRGSGVYINRERGYSIDPLYIDDPLFPANNVGRNCFRIHQCIKAFADAYCTLDNESVYMDRKNDEYPRASYNLLSKIVPSITVDQTVTF